MCSFFFAAAAFLIFIIFLITRLGPLMFNLIPSQTSTHLREIFTLLDILVVWSNNIEGLRWKDAQIEVMQNICRWKILPLWIGMDASLTLIDIKRFYHIKICSFWGAKTEEDHLIELKWEHPQIHALTVPSYAFIVCCGTGVCENTFIDIRRPLGSRVIDDWLSSESSFGSNIHN